MNIRESLEELFSEAISSAVNSGEISLEDVPSPGLERPRDASNGDWASTVAMRCAKQAHMAPRDVAQIIVSSMPKRSAAVISSIDIAGPGFINVRLANDVLQEVVRDVRVSGPNYGRSNIGQGERVNVEYVSANPTGPLHVGHGRWATLGDAIARVMRHAGYDVYEEFYVNDHGSQMDVFGNSVSVRYMQLLGHDVQMPEQCYGGAYVKDIARQIIDEHGNSYENLSDEARAEAFREIAYVQMLDNQCALLKRYGTTFDMWFSERKLYELDGDGKCLVQRALDDMEQGGFLYKKDGAVWFSSTQFGDEKDRVIIKENGEYTYFASDIAYHYNKLDRGFSRLIDVWGADHHGYIKRCEAMLAARGYSGSLEIVLGQLVNLFRDGKPVRMSKRTGEMVTFEELVDEVGVDATRFEMLSRSSDQPIDFDIDQAKKQDSTNPVYYVQYAHARICSILCKAAGEDVSDLAAQSTTIDQIANKAAPLGCDLSPLTSEYELALIRKIAEFGELVEVAAKDRAPFRLTHYSQELAASFHAFYTECRVITDDEALSCARLALCDAVRIVLALSLNLMGISAPEHM